MGDKPLSGRDYLERHVRLASLVHWSLCRVHGIPCEDKYYKHHCDPVLEHTKTNATVQEHLAPEDNFPEVGVKVGTEIPSSSTLIFSDRIFEYSSIFIS